MPIELFDLIYSAGVVALAALVAFIVNYLVHHYAVRLATSTKTHIDDLIVGAVRLPLGISIILVGIYFMLFRLEFLQVYIRYIGILLNVIWILIGGYILYKLAGILIPFFGIRAGIPKSPLNSIRKIVMWLIVIFTILALMGLAGIELGSVIAVVMLVLGTIIFLCFAGWSILGNVTGGIVLMAWRPFEVGDRIELIPENIKGEVIDINLMFLKLKLDGNEVMSIPNTLVLQKFIKNLGHVG